MDEDHDPVFTSGYNIRETRDENLTFCHGEPGKFMEKGVLTVNQNLYIACIACAPPAESCLYRDSWRWHNVNTAF